MKGRSRVSSSSVAQTWLTSQLLAAVLTELRMRRATADEARDFTGFAIGGIPPFGHTRQIRTVMDPDLGRFATVWAAAGTPNAVFPLAPATLRMLANAVVAPIANAPMRQPEQPPTLDQAPGTNEAAGAQGAPDPAGAPSGA